MNGCDNVAMILAMARDGAIGHRGGLLCHLAADLKRFKALTMDHAVIMGRKTWQSLPNGALPGRQNIVVTRNRGYQSQGVTVVHSIDEALAAATMPGEVFVIGGAEIYCATFDTVTTIYLTVIDHEFEGADAHFPRIDLRRWTIVDRSDHPADERNPYPFAFMTLRRKKAVTHTK